MRKFGIFIVPFFVISSAVAQSTEYSVHLNSGFFSFGDESAVENSFIIVSDVGTIPNYTNNPYGKEKTLSYGLTAQIQRISNRNVILGFQTGYEILKSNVQIEAVSGEFLEPPTVTSGQTTLTHGFITLYPHAGKRFIIGNFETDLSFGPEFGFGMLSREKGEAITEEEIKIETDTERNNPGTDIRLRPSLTVYYENWGFSAGYSYGVHNYSDDLIGAERERYSRLIRFGISYKIN